MIVLKPLIIDSTGWLEATWVDRVQAPDVVIPAKDAVLDEEGNEVTPAEPERTEPGQVTETQVQCTSYHPTQIDLLRADAATHGTELDETQLAEWVAAYVPPAPEVKSPEELQAEIIAATQQRLDDFAKTRNYDGILSLCTYATSLNSKFKVEGQYGVEARDATWSALYAILEEVQGGHLAPPTGYADIEPLLPVLTWPQ